MGFGVDLGLRMDVHGLGDPPVPALVVEPVLGTRGVVVRQGAHAYLARVALPPVVPRWPGHRRRCAGCVCVGLGVMDVHARVPGAAASAPCRTRHARTHVLTLLSVKRPNNTSASSTLNPKPRILNYKTLTLNPHSSSILKTPSESLDPAPYTLHPTACTLHPTPCTLHSALYTLHSTPCTLHPAPYTMQPAPYILHPAFTPYTLYHKSCELCLTGFEQLMHRTGVSEPRSDEEGFRV